MRVRRTTIALAVIGMMVVPAASQASCLIPVHTAHLDPDRVEYVVSGVVSGPAHSVRIWARSWEDRDGNAHARARVTVSEPGGSSTTIEGEPAVLVIDPLLRSAHVQASIPSADGPRTVSMSVEGAMPFTPQGVAVHAGCGHLVWEGVSHHTSADGTASATVPGFDPISDAPVEVGYLWVEHG